MPRSGPPTARRYSDAFKLAAVRLSQNLRIVKSACTVAMLASYA